MTKTGRRDENIDF